MKKYASRATGLFTCLKAAGFCLVLLSLTAIAVMPAVAATGKTITHNTPRYVSSAKNLGPVSPSETTEVTIWLQPHNRAQLDALAHSLYDTSSPNFRKFLNRAEIAKRFAPSAAEAAKVQKFFESHNLKTVRVGPDNFFVRARGTVGDVQSAFHVQLNNYQVGDKVIRSNSADPFIDDEASSLVYSVSGLDNGKYEHPSMQRAAMMPSQTKGGYQRNAAPGAAPGALFSSVCFNGNETETFSNNNDGSYPVGTYTGKHLNLNTLTSDGCAYTPPVVQTAYNLTSLYKSGWDGTGQTIAILDWCGSSTITQDANAFSKKFGLPQLTASNFQIIYTPTQSLCISPGQVEINIDVEWAHAVAPGANINLIVPPSASFQDVNEAEYTTINYGLGTVLSGSYGSIESFTPASELANENLISEIAAVSGISTNFSSGDYGDFSYYGIPPTVSAPADSPWATAVGGITLSLHSDNSIAWQAGWGNNETLLAASGEVFDPPLAFGFIGGAGGGPSNCASQDSSGNCLAGFPKPPYQSGIAGTTRQLPDVAWLADPFTGVAILISEPGSVPIQVWQVWGGTSVAAPMFTGLWAIAQQAAGAPLGQAAPYMYSMPAGAMYDIVPVNQGNKVTASIKESTGTNNYNASQVLGGTTPGNYVSALWDYPYEQLTSLVLSFGTDCTTAPGFGVVACNQPGNLHTKAGWDNVTGNGVPNAPAFVGSFAAPKKK